MTSGSTAAAGGLKLPLKRVALIVLAIVAFLVPYFVTFDGLSVPGHRMFSIFLLAIVLWVSEAIPLHASAALIIFLQILTLSDKAMIGLPADFVAPAYSQFYGALAHPVLMLFLGGFFLADGAAKYQLDRNMARVLLKPFGSRPKMIMLGLMLITAVFSMFMSNTATTATMMAVVLPVIAGLPAGDRLRTGLALSIPVAANIGGMGTPVGTPPNAIALGALSQAGMPLTFVQWMIMAIPGVIITLAFAWLALSFLFRSSTESIEVKIESTFNASLGAKVFYFTFILTVGMWLTEPLHHVKASIVGFIPVVILLSTGVFTAKDLQSVQWHVLWLVAGGIALGTGVGASGLDQWLIGLVEWQAMSPAVISAALCLVALVMSCLISNSATANLLVPIGMSLAASGTVQMDPVLTAVFIALGASLAMVLPISTPPNAIAYSTGAVKTRDMVVIGALVGVFGWVLFAFFAPKLWTLIGVLG